MGIADAAGRLTDSGKLGALSAPLTRALAALT
jgi:hypothetical protein